jgi:hypothetical protein
MKETGQKRPLAAHSSSFRAYEDNYEEVMRMCEASGRRPAEELRDLLDEALNYRRERQDGQEIARLAETIRQVTEKGETHSRMIVSLAQHMREQYGLILETLAGAYGARHIVWKYVVEPLLREEGLTSEQIRRRLEEECQAWNSERDAAADMIEQAIRNIRPLTEAGSATT